MPNIDIKKLNDDLKKIIRDRIRAIKKTHDEHDPIFAGMDREVINTRKQLVTEEVLNTHSEIGAFINTSLGLLGENNYRFKELADFIRKASDKYKNSSFASSTIDLRALVNEIEKVNQVAIKVLEQEYQKMLKPEEKKASIEQLLNRNLAREYITHKEKSKGNISASSRKHLDAIAQIKKSVRESMDINDGNKNSSPEERARMLYEKLNKYYTENMQSWARRNSFLNKSVEDELSSIKLNFPEVLQPKKAVVSAPKIATAPVEELAGKTAKPAEPFKKPPLPNPLPPTPKQAAAMTAVAALAAKLRSEGNYPKPGRAQTVRPKASTTSDKSIKPKKPVIPSRPHLSAEVTNALFKLKESERAKQKDPSGLKGAHKPVINQLQAALSKVKGRDVQHSPKATPPSRHTPR